MTRQLRIMAVIHHRDDATSHANAALAAAKGCHGVFFIHMQARDALIDAPAVAAKRAFPELIVGTNRLSTHPCAALRRDVELGLDATWCDNPGVYSHSVEPLALTIADELDRIRRTNPDHLYFGSVAFKTQSEDPDPPAAAVAAADLGWIATTSGVATGSAPDPEKLRSMKAALGDRPLAVASGVDPDNVTVLGPHLDWVLVATGVSKDFYSFDPDRLGRLVRRANELSKAAA